MLVVSAWLEGAPPRLAARITYTLDVRQPDRVTVTAAGVEEIEAVHRSYKRELVRWQPPGEVLAIKHTKPFKIQIEKTQET